MTVAIKKGKLLKATLFDEETPIATLPASQLRICTVQEGRIWAERVVTRVFVDTDRFQ